MHLPPQDIPENNERDKRFDFLNDGLTQADFDDLDFTDDDWACDVDDDWADDEDEENYDDTEEEE